jgi:hypothetical protein
MIKSYEWCVELKNTALALSDMVKGTDLRDFFDDKRGDYAELEALLGDLYALQREATEEKDVYLGVILQRGGFGFHMFNNCYGPKGKLIYGVALQPSMRLNAGHAKAQGTSGGPRIPFYRSPKTMLERNATYKMLHRTLEEIAVKSRPSATVRCCNLANMPANAFGRASMIRKTTVTALNYNDDYVLSPAFNTYSRPRRYISDPVIDRDMVTVASGLRNDRARMLGENMKLTRTFTSETELNYVHVCLKVVQDALSSITSTEYVLKQALFAYFNQSRGDGRYVEPLSLKLTLYRGAAPVQHYGAASLPYDEVNAARATSQVYVTVPNVTVEPAADYSFAGRKDELQEKWNTNADRVRRARDAWTSVDFALIDAEIEGVI